MASAGALDPTKLTAGVRRRKFMMFIGSAATAWSLSARAQTEIKMPRVGIILLSGPGPILEALREGLGRHGYVEGQNIVLEPRFAQGQFDRVPDFAAELVRLDVGVIVAVGAVGARSAQKATTKIPIVFAMVLDPVAAGFATTLERPGGNLTGITTFDMQQATKQFELFREVIPQLARVAILSDHDIPRAEADRGWNPLERANDTAARRLGLQPQMLRVKGPAPDLEGAFTAMINEHAEALLILEVPVTIAHRKGIAALATKYRLPTMFAAGLADAGGLIAYGTSIFDAVPRLPNYVAKILKGAKPGEMPIEAITRRELVFNLKTAQEIGVTIPPEILKRADQVLQ
jgi:putative tryptophan/tyrosine transport system substrate-binding protein